MCTYQIFKQCAHNELLLNVLKHKEDNDSQSVFYQRSFDLETSPPLHSSALQMLLVRAVMDVNLCEYLKMFWHTVYEGWRDDQK